MVLTKDKLKSILSADLHLREPEYHLRKVSNRWVGHVISPSFKGKSDLRRLEMIWDALEAQLGPDAPKRVGLLLAYTPDEWNLGNEDQPKRRKAG